MILPTFTNQQFVDKDGLLTPAMQDYMDLQAQALQNGLSNNGWTLPQITAADLAKIASNMPDGTMWYETTNKEFVIKINNVLVKVLTGAYP